MRLFKGNWGGKIKQNKVTNENKSSRFCVHVAFFAAATEVAEVPGGPFRVLLAVRFLSSHEASSPHISFKITP